MEKYTEPADGAAAHRGGLPIHHLREVEDYVAEHLAEEITVETLAGIVELSPSHSAHVFKGEPQFPGRILKKP